MFHDHSVELSAHFNVTECVFNLDLPNAYPSGNSVVTLGVEGAPGLLGKLKSFWKRIQRLKQIKRDNNIILSISHLEGADYANLLSPVGEKTIAVIHGSKVYDDSMVGWSGWLRQQVLLPLFYRWPDHIVTVSRELRSEMINHYGVKPERVTTINNFFYPEAILAKAALHIDAQYESLFQQPRVMITSGRMVPQKNQAPLLDVFAELLKIQPDAKLVILGDGDLRGSLVARAQALGLRYYQAWNNDPLDQECDLYFLGFQSNPFRYIKRASLFVFPSDWEGFPMALCESMICGVPVVSTDCPTGPREILAPATPPETKINGVEWAKNGVMLPLLNGDYQQHVLPLWVQTLKQMLNDDKLRAHYGQQGSRRMQDFTSDVIFQKWSGIIERVLTTK